MNNEQLIQDAGDLEELDEQEHLSKEEDEAEKIGDDLRQNA